MFVGKQIFVGSWDVISRMNFAMSPGKITLTLFIYKLRKELSFLYFIMLQRRGIFLVNTSRGELKPFKEHSSPLDCENNDRNYKREIVCD